MFLTWFGFFLVVFVGMLLIQGPDRLRKIDWFSMKPLITPLGGGGPLLPSDESPFFQEISRQLLGLGFEHRGEYTITQGSFGVLAVMAAYVEPRTFDLAMATVTIVTTGQVHRKAYSVIVTTMYDNGDSVAVANDDFLRTAAESRRVQTWKFPGMADLGLLYRIHRELTHGRTEKAREPNVDFAIQMRSDWEEMVMDQVRRGFLYYNRAEDRYRYTRRGALVVVLSVWWPASSIQRKRRKARADAMLRSLNLPTEYETIDYAALVNEKSPGAVAGAPENTSLTGLARESA